MRYLQGGKYCRNHSTIYITKWSSWYTLKKASAKQCTNELDNRYMLIWSHGQHKPQIDTKPLYTAKWNKTSSLNATKGKQVWWDYQTPKNGSFKSIHSSYNSRLWGQFSLRLLYSTPQMIIIQGIANLLTICVFACVSIFYNTLYKVMILFMWKTPETYTGSGSQSMSHTTCLFKVLKQAGWLISRMALPLMAKFKPTTAKIGNSSMKVSKTRN